MVRLEAISKISFGLQRYLSEGIIRSEGTQFNLPVVDMMGRSLFNRSVTLMSGQTFTLPTSILSPGTYYLEVIGEEKIHVLPFVKAGH